MALNFQNEKPFQLSHNPDKEQQSDIEHSYDQEQEVTIELNELQIKEILQEYKKIADKEDSEITPWQRQVRVNHFMLEQSVREMIIGLVNPVIKAQKRIEIELLDTVQKQINKLQSQIVQLEEDLYDKASRDDKLTKFEIKIQNESSNRKMQMSEVLIGFESMKDINKKRDLQDLVMNQRFQKSEDKLQETQRLMLQTDENQKKMMDRFLNQIEDFMKTANDNIRILNQKYEQQNNVGGEQKAKLAQIEAKIGEVELQVKRNAGGISDLVNKTDELRIKKAEKETVSELQTNYQSSKKRTDEQFQKIENQQISVSNYMEKYMPLYIQRQMTDFLEYVLTDRALRWRINWYNEIKIPMLTTGIIFDNGRESLKQRMKELNNLVINNIMPALPREPSAMTPEEEFVQIALRSREVHARAKVIIMQMLNQIQNNPDAKSPQKNIRKNKIQKDYRDASVTEMFNDMLAIIKKQNPEIVEQMMIENQAYDQGIAEAQKIMEEDLENDNSIEARIEREVKKCMSHAQQELQVVISDRTDDAIEMLKRLHQSGEDELQQRTQQTQNYIQEVHSFQIQEMANFKDCHNQYLASAAQFDRKLQAVVGIENNNVQILKQLKNLNEIVSELSSANIAAFSENNLLTYQDSQGVTNYTVSDAATIEKMDSQIKNLVSPKNYSNMRRNSDINISNFIAGPSTSIIKLGQSKNNGTVIMQPIQATNLVPNFDNSKITSQFIINLGTVEQRSNAQETHLIADQLEKMQNLFLRDDSLQVVTLDSRPKTQQMNQRLSNRAGSLTQTLKYQAAYPQKSNLIAKQLTTKGQVNSFLQSGDITSKQIVQRRNSSTFQMVKNNASRNINILSKMILDEDAEMGSEATKYASKAQNKRKLQSTLPSTGQFIRKIADFKERLCDTRLGDAFASNPLNNTEERRAPTPNPKSVPITLDLKNKSKVKLGIRRQDSDTDGNKIMVTSNINQEIFEPSVKNGQIEIFNKAAGIEHQIGKHCDQLVFDQKAVLNSLKSFI